MSVAVTRNGHKVVSGSADKTVKVWGVSSRKCLQTFDDKTGNGHKDSVNCIAITADGRSALSGSSDHTLALWNLESKGLKVLGDFKQKNNLSNFLFGHKDKISSVAVTEDGKRAVSGAFDHRIKVWALDTMTCLKTLEGRCDFHTAAVTSVVFIGKECKRIASTSNDKTVKVWDLESMVCVQTLTGHKLGITAAAVIDEGKTLLSLSNDKAIKVWNLDSVAVHTIEDSDIVSSIAMLEEEEEGSGKRLVSASQKGTLKLWVEEEEKMKCNRTVQAAHDNAISAVTIYGHEDEDGVLNRVYSASLDKTIKVWDLDTMDLVTTLEGHNHGVNSIKVYDKGKKLVSCSNDCKLKIWDLGTSKCVNTLEGHREYVNSVAVIRNGERLASGSNDNTVRIWDQQSGKCLKILKGHDDNVRSIAVIIESSKTLLASGSDDKTIKIWSLDNEKMECVNTLEGHEGPITSIAASDDGKKLVSGARDHTIKVWELSIFECVQTLQGHTDIVSSVAMPGMRNKWVISSSSDKTIKFWDLKSFLLSRPPGVRHVFHHEKEVARVTPNFKWPKTQQMFRRYPIRLMDWHWSRKRTENTNEGKGTTNHYQTFLHTVCEEGRADLLKLLLERTKGGDNVAFAACLVKDSSGNTPLKTAIEKKSGSCVQVLFQCFKDVFGSAETILLTGERRQREIHLTDAFSESDLCLALQDFPAYASDFLVKSAPLLPAYKAIVMREMHLFDLKNESRIVLGSEDRSPINFWMSMLYPQKMCENNAEGKQSTRRSSSVARNWNVPLDGYPVGAVRQTGERVDTKLVPFNGIAKSDSDFLRSVVAACDSLQKYNLCESEVVSSLIHFKWSECVEPAFMKDLYLYVLLVFSFTYDALVYDREKIDAGSAAELIFYMILPMACTFALWCYFVLHESKQIAAEKIFANKEYEKKKATAEKEGATAEDGKIQKPTYSSTALKHFATNLWDFLDGLTLLTIFGTYLFRIWSISTDNNKTLQAWSTASQCLALPLVYLSTLFYLKAFEKSGELVCMIVGIIKGIGPFMIILLDVVIGFAFGIFVLYRGSDLEFNKSDYKNPLIAVFSAYTTMLGEFHLSDFEKSGSFEILAILFFTFTVLVNIVLLNLLIALMGDIFDRIQENAQGEFLYARACIVLEFESLLSEKYRKSHVEKFPEWLQVLVPAASFAEEGNGGETTPAAEHWGGKMKRIRVGQEAVSLEVTKVKRTLEEGQESIRVEVKKRCGKIETEIESMRRDMEEIKTLLLEAHKRNKFAESYVEGLTEEGVKSQAT